MQFIKTNLLDNVGYLKLWAHSIHSQYVDKLKDNIGVRTMRQK